jgi:hypothetical protein
VAFKDIKPAAKFHFLVIPKQHIPDVKSLTKKDKEMGENFSAFWSLSPAWPIQPANSCQTFANSRIIFS